MRILFDISRFPAVQPILKQGVRHGKFLWVCCIPIVIQTFDDDYRSVLKLNEITQFQQITVFERYAALGLPVDNFFVFTVDPDI